MSPVDFDLLQNEKIISPGLQLGGHQQYSQHAVVTFQLQFTPLKRDKGFQGFSVKEAMRIALQEETSILTGHTVEGVRGSHLAHLTIRLKLLSVFHVHT